MTDLAKIPTSNILQVLSRPHSVIKNRPLTMVNKKLFRAFLLVTFAIVQMEVMIMFITIELYEIISYLRQREMCVRQHLTNSVNFHSKQVISQS